MDKGKELYEKSLQQEPTYRATGKQRPQWDQLSEQAQDAWRKQAEDA